MVIQITWDQLRRSFKELKMKIGNTEIQVEKGDICEDDSYCIVNAANDHLQLGGGVAGAIRMKGGKQVQKECDDWIHQFGPVKTGDCACTGPGELRCTYIIHAVGPIYRDGNSGEAKLLEEVLFNTYKCCEELKATSVALPAISSGIFGFPKDQVASIFFNTTINFLKHNETPLQYIRFKNFDDPTHNIFLAEYRRWTSKFPDDVQPSNDASKEKRNMEHVDPPSILPVTSEKRTKKHHASPSKPKAKKDPSESQGCCCCLLM